VLLLPLLQPPVLLMAERLVLFVCVENAARSLMAEAMFNADPPPGWRAISAGTHPAPAANPRTKPMLAELGVTAPEHPPLGLTPEMMERAGVRVTMGCLDDASCPAHLPTLALRDWKLEDPARLDDAGFRRIRDQLATWVRGLHTELALADRTASAPVEATRT
jgi:arsenate reductase (thioredoxin)